MRKKIKVEIENTPNQVKEITAILEGENKDHCLFIGPWENVNINSRNYFFKSFMSDFNAKNIRQVNVPVFAAIGLHDGIAPPYLIPNMIEKGQLPKNFTYIFLINLRICHTINSHMNFWRD